MKTLCEKCGREFNTKPCLLKIGKSKYCSQECAGQRKVSRVELYDDLRRVANELGHRPSTLEYEERGNFSRVVLHRHGGLRAVWESMGLSFKPRLIHPPVDRNILVLDLHRVRKVLGRIPSSKEYVKYGKHSFRTALKVFGVLKWFQVVVCAFDLTQLEIARMTPPSYRTYHMWVVLIKSLSEELGRTPKSTEAYNRICLKPSIYPALKGKTFRMILGDAGLCVTPRKSSSIKTNPHRLKPLSLVPDELRDRLKESSVEAIQDFFKRKDNYANKE